MYLSTYYYILQVLTDCSASFKVLNIVFENCIRFLGIKLYFLMKQMIFLFLLSFILWLIPNFILEEYYSLLISESILANFFSGFFTATIFIPGIIILTNLFPGVFTAAGITEPPFFLEWNEWKNPQFNFSSQYLSIERNFFKWDGKETKILHLLFHRIWKKPFI